MAIQTWVQTANSGQPSGLGKGEVYKKSTTLTDVSPGGKEKGPLTIPANYLEVGKIIRCSASGIFSTTSKPTLVLGIYWGGVTGVALCETIAITSVETAANISWLMEAQSTVLSLGTSGKIITQGQVVGVEAKSLTSTSAGTTLMPEETATGGEATINTVESKILTIGAKWGTESESNALTCYQFSVEFLN